MKYSFRLISFCVIPFCLFSVGLMAADFWQAKPYTEWSEKDSRKLLTNSPWARSFTLPMTGSAMGAGGRSGGRGGGGGGGGRSGAGSEAAPVSTEIVARWQSALPLKQALMRLRFGAEAATSPQAKEFLDQAETAYIIVLSGPLRAAMRGDRRGNSEGNPQGIPGDLKAALMAATTLTTKGRDALKLTDVQITTNETPPEVVLYFPRSIAYTLDDKEVELSTKLGNLSLNFKFHLKDMVFNGNLAL